MSEEEKAGLENFIETSKTISSQSQQKFDDFLEKWKKLEENFPELDPRIQKKIDEINAAGLKTKISKVKKTFKKFDDGLEHLMNKKAKADKLISFYDRYRPDTSDPFRSLEVMQNLFTDLESFLPDEKKNEMLKNTPVWLIRTGIVYFKTAIELASGGLKDIQKKIKSRAGNCIGYIGGDSYGDSNDPKRKAYEDMSTGDIICYSKIRPIKGEIWANQTGKKAYLWSNKKWEKLNCDLSGASDIFYHWKLAYRKVISAPKMIAWCNTEFSEFSKEKLEAKQLFIKLSSINSCQSHILAIENQKKKLDKVMSSVNYNMNNFIANYIFKIGEVYYLKDFLSRLVSNTILFRASIKDIDEKAIANSKVTINIGSESMSVYTNKNGFFEMVFKRSNSNYNDLSATIKVTAENFLEYSEQFKLFQQCNFLNGWEINLTAKENNQQKIKSIDDQITNIENQLAKAIEIQQKYNKLNTEVENDLETISNLITLIKEAINKAYDLPWLQQQVKEIKLLSRQQTQWLTDLENFSNTQIENKNNINKNSLYICSCLDTLKKENSNDRGDYFVSCQQKWNKLIQFYNESESIAAKENSGFTAYINFAGRLKGISNHHPENVKKSAQQLIKLLHQTELNLLTMEQLISDLSTIKTQSNNTINRLSSSFNNTSIDSNVIDYYNKKITGLTQLNGSIQEIKIADNHFSLHRNEVNIFIREWSDLRVKVSEYSAQDSFELPELNEEKYQRIKKLYSQRVDINTIRQLFNKTQSCFDKLSIYSKQTKDNNDAEETSYIDQADKYLNSCDRAKLIRVRDKLSNFNPVPARAKALISKFNQQIKSSRDFSSSKDAYFKGKLLQSKSYLRQAEKSKCSDIISRVSARQNRITRMQSALHRADKSIQDCNISQINSMISNFASVSHLLTKNKTVELKQALEQCAEKKRSKPVVKKITKPLTQTQAEYKCTKKYGDGVITSKNKDASFTCRCGSDYIKNKTKTGCISKKRVRDDGNKYCAKKISRGILKKVISIGKYECGCAKSLRYSKSSKACLSKKEIITKGKNICKLNGKVLAFTKSNGQYICCPSNKPHYKKSTNTCYTQKVKTKKKVQYKEHPKQIIRKRDPPKIKVGSSNTCKRLWQEMQLLSQQMTPTVASYSGQKDVACKMMRASKKQQEIIGKLKKARCKGAESLSQMKIPINKNCR
ncbi:MAG: hypothetical protein KZQ83_19670 [gamma proteobacterium symbiont of Taylorina sp.]|nr:hypothetical protein [gamma proteobacterium symbiont of Taylorina sp.]